MPTAVPSIAGAPAASRLAASGAIGKDVPVADTYWRSLTYFNIYRLIIALVLFAGTQPALDQLSLLSILSGSAKRVLVVICGAYIVACVASLVVLWRVRRNFNLQLSLQVVTDVLVFSAFIYFGGGLRSGLGVMLLVTLAGAGLVGQGRLTIFYAALATIGVLTQEVLHALTYSFEPADFVLAGILSLGFFGTAGSALLLARRLVANEELARRRGVALRHQMQVSEQVISAMQDGVLVVSADGLVQQSNPRARELLGAAAGGDSLAGLSPLLDAAHAKWLLGSGADVFEFRAPGSGRQVQVRFVRIEGEAGDTLAFVEDAGRVREESQRIKLAALGRLTASIAHEIRNPLSAIRHANELLAESRQSPEDERLIRIMADNTRRLEGIVSDILQIGRRDRAQRETIDLGAYISGFLEQFTHSAAVSRSLIRTAIVPGATLAFDRSHLHQILWNLASNAIRHGRGGDGSIRLWTEAGDGWCALHLADDGPGVGNEQRARIFEPFYTTDAKGTGLGLFIARELADANGARLDLLDNAPGAHFSLLGERAA